MSLCLCSLCCRQNTISTSKFYSWILLGCLSPYLDLKRLVSYLQLWTLIVEESIYFQMLSSQSIKAVCIPPTSSIARVGYHCSSCSLYLVTEMLCALLQLINWRMKGSSLQFLLCLLIFQLFTRGPHETSFIWQTEWTHRSSLIFFSCNVLLWFSIGHLFCHISKLEGKGIMLDRGSLN
jgi:hypothetical protein